MKFYVYAVSPVGNVYIARDGGLTPELNEADLNTEDIADDLSVLATTEFDMAFDIKQDVEDVVSYKE
jgi:hypothetical protein